MAFVADGRLRRCLRLRWRARGTREIAPKPIVGSKTLQSCCTRTQEKQSLVAARDPGVAAFIDAGAEHFARPALEGGVENPVFQCGQDDDGPRVGWRFTRIFAARVCFFRRSGVGFTRNGHFNRASHLGLRGARLASKP